jgi:hypothetical protein
LRLATGVERALLGSLLYLNARLGSVYRSGRSPNWVKVKNPPSTGSKARDRGGLEPLIEKTGRKNARRKSNCSNQLDRIHTIKRERTY